MADEKNTTDKTVVDPNNPDIKIDNPDYVAPAAPAAAPAAAAQDLDLTAAPAAEAVLVGKTGNASIDAVGKLLAEKAVPGADDMIAEFAKNGELSISSQAKLVETLGESLAGMAINQLNAEATKIKDASTAARTEVLDYMIEAFGETDRDATWAAVKEFVASPESGFSADDKAELSKMLQKGGLAAKLAIDNIVAVHTGNPNTTVTADLLQGDISTVKGFDPISAKAYSEEVSILADKYGYESLEVQQLQQRRERSRNAGIA